MAGPVGSPPRSGACCAHALDPVLAEGPLAVTAAAGSALFTGGPITIHPGCSEQALLLDLLVQLEVRCAHDPVAVRAALDRPSPELSGQTLRMAPAGLPTIERMRAARAAAGTLPIPKVKMWRIVTRDRVGSWRPMDAIRPD